MIYFQAIIQFWQLVVLQGSGNGSRQGIYYGIIFTLILFAQSFSGHVAEKKSTRHSVTFIVSSGVFSSFLLAWPSSYSMYFTSASVVLMFFSNRLMTIILLSKIYEDWIAFELYGNMVFLTLFVATLIAFWFKRGEL